MSAAHVVHHISLQTSLSRSRHVQSLLEEGKTSLVRELLDDDRRTFDYVKEHLTRGISALDELVQGAQVLYSLQTSLTANQPASRSSLEVDALRGELHDSPWERTILLRLRKSNSESLRRVLMRLHEVSTGGLHETCDSTLQKLDDLLEAEASNDGPLRSAEDVQNSTLRTTVIAKKVELSKQTSALTKGDAAYSDLLRIFTGFLDTYLNDALIDPKTLPFNEIFLYDIRSPHRDVFTPKPRFAVERALAAPYDYLDCECCAPDSHGSDENTLSSSQPATAILYQLYLESGAMINASDLRTAFFAIMNPDEEHEANTS